MFLLKKLISLLILPPLSPVLLVILGLLLLRRAPRLGRGLAWAGALIGLLLITPPLVRQLTLPLEAFDPPTAPALAQAQAVVVLGGGARRYAPEFEGETVNRLTLERLRYGARLARQTGLPILVTGGAPENRIPEGRLMAQSLEQDFRLPVRWVEDQARDTAENARYSARLLQPDGVRRILLVTHAAHMARSVAEFEQAGFTVIPAPTAYLVGRPPSDSLLPELPNMNAAYGGWYAVHEWVGLLAQRLR